MIRLRLREQAVALARRLAAERDATLSAFEAVPPRRYVRDPWNEQPEIDDLLGGSMSQQLGDDASVPLLALPSRRPRNQP